MSVESTERDEVIAKLRAWLLARRPTLAPDALDADTDIVATRILESLQLVEFLLYVERLSGRPVLVEGLDPRELRSLGAIHRRYWIDCVAGSGPIEPTFEPHPARGARRGIDRE